MVFRTLAHGTLHGMVTGVQGGNFWSGFANGAISSMVSSVWAGGKMADKSIWKGSGGIWGSGDVGTGAFGTISGAAGAALTGGNFWEGTTTGLTVSLLNHMAHSQDGDPSIRSTKDTDITPIGPETPLTNPDGSPNFDAYNCHSFAWEGSMGGSPTF